LAEFRRLLLGLLALLAIAMAVALALPGRETHRFALTAPPLPR
jgi:hypothetical protein